MNTSIASIVSQYPTSDLGTFQASTPIEVGLIHATHQVKTTRGLYCLQRLHPKLSSDGILQDYQVVTDYLHQAQFPAPRLLLTAQGHRAVTDETGQRWRLTTWLLGHNTSTVRSLGMVRSSAAMFGRFHRIMADLEYRFQSTHPLHNTRYHLDNMRSTVTQHQGDPWLTRILPWVEEIETHLPTLLLPPDLPQCVVHGDPKISNLLFDDSDQAIALLDLDTCTRHSPLVDLGDAIRAWCCVSDHTDKPAFDIARFEAILEGYAQAGGSLDAYTLQFLPHAGRLITLELASRFLTDVLQDSYFAWDPTQYPSRREHNLHRAQTMVAFAQKLEQALPVQHDLVRRIFPHSP